MDRKTWTEPFDTRLVAGGMSMARGDLIAIRGGRGALVFAESGTVWLTQDHDARDVVLEAGEWFRLDRDGTALVQAHRAATVTITAPDEGLAREVFRPTPDARPRRGTWVRRFWAAWLRMYRRHPSERRWDVGQRGSSARRAPARDPLAARRRLPRDPAADLRPTIELERARLA